MSANTAKTAVIYARTGVMPTATEADQAYNSIKTQVEDCTEYARAKGYTVAEVFSEAKGVSPESSLTELERAIGFAKKKGVEVFLFTSPDRVSRDQMHLNILIERLYAAGIQAESVRVSLTIPVDLGENFEGE